MTISEIRDILKQETVEKTVLEEIMSLISEIVILPPPEQRQV